MTITISDNDSRFSFSPKTPARDIQNGLMNLAVLKADLRRLEAKADEAIGRGIEAAKNVVRTITLADAAERSPGITDDIMSRWGDAAYEWRTVTVSRYSDPVYGILREQPEGWLAIHADVSEWGCCDDRMGLLARNDNGFFATKREAVFWLVEQSIRKRYC